MNDLKHTKRSEALAFEERNASAEIKEERVAGTYSLGIDIGGTFTDIVAYDQATGQIVKAKELTTPDDPSRGVIIGIRNLLGADEAGAEDFSRMVHATTLFTNAIITREGAKTGMLTTAGFRDAVEIGRERKFELYDVFISKPEPLVPRNLRAEVPERIGPDGEVLTPIDLDALRKEVDGLVAQGVESLAVVFLHCYANAAHEDAAIEAITAEHPDLFVSASHDVSPEIREYERGSTTSANAYVKRAGAAVSRQPGCGSRKLRDEGAVLYDAVKRWAHAYRRGEVAPGVAA